MDKPPSIQDGDDPPLFSIRPAVRQYIEVCEHFLAGDDGAVGQFKEACAALKLKLGDYNSEELVLIAEMLALVTQVLEAGINEDNASQREATNGDR